MMLTRFAFASFYGLVLLSVCTICISISKCVLEKNYVDNQWFLLKIKADLLNILVETY